MTDTLEVARSLLESRRSGAILTALGGGGRAVIDASGRVIGGEMSGIEAVLPEALAMIEAGRSGVVAAASAEVFVEVLAPGPRLLVFGAGPISEALCAMAAVAGFDVEVADPRPAFARVERFPDAAAVRVGWPGDLVSTMAPDGASYAVSLLHEARFEDELLPALLGTEVRYIGALGSQRTHAGRVRRLEEAGFSARDTARIKGPIGLDIGAVTPAEIAVAIIAEVVAARRGADR